MEEEVETRERVRRMSQPRMEPKSEGERMKGMCEKTDRRGERDRDLLGSQRGKESGGQRNRKRRGWKGAESRDIEEDLNICVLFLELCVRPLGCKSEEC